MGNVERGVHGFSLTVLTSDVVVHQDGPDAKRLGHEQHLIQNIYHDRPIV
jgi:hypothetical protein